MASIKADMPRDSTIVFAMDASFKIAHRGNNALRGNYANRMSISSTFLINNNLLFIKGRKISATGMGFSAIPIRNRCEMFPKCDLGKSMSRNYEKFYAALCSHKFKTS